ncbi:MAG: MotA/TolQ/ExbB proton channel family protein [Myxococcota bacterium]
MKRFPILALAFSLGLPSLAGAQNTEQAAPNSGKSDFDLSLREAYQKEFGFLAGQRRQLEKRLQSFEERAKKERARLEGALSRLENQVIGIDDQIREAASKLDAADRDAQSSGDEKLLAEATLDQARASLSDFDAKLPKVELRENGTPTTASIEKTFESAIEVLEKLRSVHTEKNAEFFLADGKKVRGDVVYVGRIAAYGVSPEGSGALAPAGGGKLKVWPGPSAEAAKALAKGQAPDKLPIFLYESIDGRVDDEVEETILKHINDGGAIAWVIVGLGLFGLLLAAVRAFLLSQAASGAQQVESAVLGMVRKGQYADAASTASRMKGSASRVVATVFSALQGGGKKVDEAISEGMLGESRRIQRFGTVILVIAAVSPLLGLLGTVTGMISTFDVITKFGTGDPKLLSGGISTALITTELGLVVAIPTLLLGNLLKGWADGIESESERTALRLITQAPDLELPAQEGPTQVG